MKTKTKQNQRYKVGSGILILSAFLILASCKTKTSEQLNQPQEFTTALGKVYTLSEPSEKLLQQFEDARV
ncbi:MAG: hypothetical protein KJO90_03485, partial [Eudoraea sp.]|nr:hypothetical protein [Eudoraea sp.]